jgi:hypothetical protein
MTHSRMKQHPRRPPRMEKDGILRKEMRGIEEALSLVNG